MGSMRGTTAGSGLNRLSWCHFGFRRDFLGLVFMLTSSLVGHRQSATYKWQAAEQGLAGTPI
jgi:hypothetical protein